MSDEPLRRSLELVAKIVAAYLRRNHVPADQLGTLISTVHGALAGLGRREEEPPAPLNPAVPIERSVQRDYVICLDCGFRGQVLRGHIATAHGLTADQYRARWDLPREHPLTAPAHSEMRSAVAKRIGLGRRGRGRPPSGSGKRAR